MPAVMAGAAVAGVVLQGAGMLSGFKAKKKAQKSMKRIRRRQLPMLDVQYREGIRQSNREQANVRGEQMARSAAGNTMVGRGTDRILGQETEDEFARARQLAAMSYSAERTAAIEGSSLNGLNYASGLAALTQSIGQAYSVGKESGVFGTDVPKPASSARSAGAV